MQTDRDPAAPKTGLDGSAYPSLAAALTKAAEEIGDQLG